MARYADIDVLLEHLTTSDEGNFRTAITQWLEMHQVEDVAPVIHAHWEYRYDMGIYQTEFLCSRCKGLIETYSCTVDEVEYEYCPHCGAKMDEMVEE